MTGRGGRGQAIPVGGDNWRVPLIFKRHHRINYTSWRRILSRCSVSCCVEGTVKGRARSEPDGTRWCTGGEVKEKLANGVGSQYSHATSERGLSSITQADAHTSAASSLLNWRPHRFKWARPFRGKTKSGFCACAITFRMSYTLLRSFGEFLTALRIFLDLYW